MATTTTVLYGQTTEALVSHTNPTSLPRMTNGRAVEIQNLGPYNIWVALGAASACVVGKCRRLQPGETWSMAIPGTCPIYALAETADQLTTAATVINEVAQLPA